MSDAEPMDEGKAQQRRRLRTERRDTQKQQRAERRIANREAARLAKFRRVETSFLPAALEVTETPPSPIGRLILWLILAAAAAVLAWASFAQVDIVAVAEGRVIPRSRLQSVEAAEGGVIRAIHVHEGQRVRAGQPLIGLDPTFADADNQSAAVELTTAQLARARSEALLAFAAGEEPIFTPPEGADPAAAVAEEAAVRARISALRERLAGLDQRILGARAARDAARADRLGLEETLPLIEQQLSARESLAERGFAAPALVAQWRERAVTQRRALEARRADERRAEAETAMLARERAQALEDFRAQAAGEGAEAEAISATRTQAVRRAELREGFQVLSAPVDGIVNEVAVTTIGEVVEGGAPLVTIVPAGEELIVEALVLNRDVGFVRPGARVTIKLEAFPFTRHGYLDGIVEHVSADAITDERRGLVFPARIRITRSRLREVFMSRRENELFTPEASDSQGARGGSRMNVHQSGRYGGPAMDGSAYASFDPSTLPISPGMSAQVEVITGRRSVLSYLLSPISRATSEAGRER